MATQYQNLSSYDPEFVPDGKPYKVAIVTAEWNPKVTFELARGAKTTLIKHGVEEGNVIEMVVPGTFELTYAAAKLMSEGLYHAIIVIGCVVRGDTPHFDYVCQGVTQGITQLNAAGNIPVIFGVLTTDTMEQATDRAGGKHGNKGVEAAVTALKMTRFL